MHHTESLNDSAPVIGDIHALVNRSAELEKNEWDVGGANKPTLQKPS